MDSLTTLNDFVQGLLATSNLTNTDIADVTAERVEHDFAQDSAGVRVSFIVSNHFIGKTDEATHDALDRLLE